MTDYQDYIEAYLFIMNATNGGAGMEKQISLIGELIEMITPKKIEEAKDYEGRKIYICPICKTRLHDLTAKHCSECGQKLEEWI